MDRRFEHDWEPDGRFFTCSLCGLGTLLGSPFKTGSLYLYGVYLVKQHKNVFYVDIAPRAEGDRLISCKEFIVLSILDE